MQNHVGNSKTDNNQLNFILLGQSKVANGRIDMWGRAQDMSPLGAAREAKACPLTQHPLVGQVSGGAKPVPGTVLLLTLSRAHEQNRILS